MVKKLKKMINFVILVLKKMILIIIIKNALANIFFNETKNPILYHFNEEFWIKNR